MPKFNLAIIYKSGFAQVFAANLFSYLVAFCASIAYAHLLAPKEFGIYAFCYTIITFALLVNGFGAASGVLQFVSKSRDQQTQQLYLQYAMQLGIVFNLLLSIIILGYASITALPIANSKFILLAMAFFPLGRLYIDVIQAYLRATRQNNLLAKFSISNNMMLFVLNISGIYWHGLIGLVITTYCSYLIMILSANMLFKLPPLFRFNTALTKTHRKEFISYSIYATIGNAFAQLLFNLDILILGYIIKNPTILANYKIATIIPFALNFIPGVIMSFFYPMFAQNSDNYNYIKQLKNKVSLLIMAITIPTSLILIALATPLIHFIFGQQYSMSIMPFRILIFGLSFAALRIVYGNILASLGKARFAMWFNLGIAIINILITWSLVKNYSIIGAASAIVVIYSISAAIAGYVVNRTNKKLS